MKNKSPVFSVMRILSLFINFLVSPFASAVPALAACLQSADAERERGRLVLAVMAVVGLQVF